MPITQRFTRFLLVTTLLLATATSALAADAIKISPEKEKELLAVLRSDAPSADKAIACKKLAVDGSKDCVGDLAKLLPDPQLNSWARIALEAIPGAESADVLLKATGSLEGRLLVGVINSIGVRRDAGAAETLIGLLKNKDADVASAAAVALGRIGSDAATKSLRDNLAGAPVNVRSAVAEGLVLCAEQRHSAGKSAEAVAIYDEVRKADVPKQKVFEATRGAILARKQEGLPLLLEQFNSLDKKMFQLALGVAREFPGAEVDKAMAAQLGNAAPERAALIIQAMADRPATVLLAVILKAAGSGPKPVQLSAVSALGRIGNESCLATLLEVAVAEDAELAAAAKASLADLPGEKINAQLASLIPDSKGKSYSVLIALAGQRGIEVTPVLVKALDSSDEKVRSAALAALGETVSLKSLPVLVAQAVAPKHPEDAAAAQKALRAASVRMPDREACATELAAALGKAPAATKIVLLEILSEVGGANALKTLGTAAKSDDVQLQDAGSRILGKWSTVDAGPVLLDLAKTAPSAQFRIRSLRGYIGLARKFAMPEPERVAMCQKAFDASLQAAEQKLVLEVLKLHPSTEGLALANKASKVPELKEDATQAVTVITQKLAAKAK